MVIIIKYEYVGRVIAQDEAEFMGYIGIALGGEAHAFLKIGSNDADRNAPLPMEHIGQCCTPYRMITAHKLLLYLEHIVGEYNRTIR